MLRLVYKIPQKCFKWARDRLTSPFTMGMSEFIQFGETSYCFILSSSATKTPLLSSYVFAAWECFSLYMKEAEFLT